MMPEPDTLTADVAGLQRVFDDLLDEARDYSRKLAQCHALLFRIAYGEQGKAPRPLAGGVLPEIEALLVRHGVVAVPAETTTQGDQA